MRALAGALLLAAVGCGRAEVDPLVGLWRLNPAATQYGEDVARRTDEMMSCSPAGQRVRCAIESRYADGRVVQASFVAGYDEGRAPVTGMPDVDSVQLSRTGTRVAVAVFSSAGLPALAYRVRQSPDGASLTFESLHPRTLEPTGTVVVYDRVGDGGR